MINFWQLWSRTNKFQQKTLNTLVQALQHSSGSSNGLLATGAPPVALPAAPASAHQASAMYGAFSNQPTFNPAELLRRFPDEEPAGTSDIYGFRQGYGVYGSVDDAS